MSLLQEFDHPGIVNLMDIVNQVDSLITKAVDEVLRERKEQKENKERAKVLFNVDSDE